MLYGVIYKNTAGIRIFHWGAESPGSCIVEVLISFTLLNWVFMKEWPYDWSEYTVTLLWVVFFWAPKVLLMHFFLNEIYCTALTEVLGNSK